MSYREEQRKKVVEARESLFKDPGQGLFFGKERDFVLSEPAGNLWAGIREDAIAYFNVNRITWWQRTDEGPTGHLLSSQIACLNHLYFMRQRQDAASALLKGLDHGVEKAERVDDGYIEFEFIGKENRLNEKAFTRGANCTSIDAAMLGVMKDGSKKLFLIEWKYTEEYAKEDKYIEERSSRYDAFITDPSSPFKGDVEPTAFYFEPFYQLMRQTLLAWQCAVHRDYGISDYLHVHIVPEGNKELKLGLNSPKLQGKDIHDAWERVLKDKTKFIHATPERLMKPIQAVADTKTILAYLERRYWD